MRCNRICTSSIRLQVIPLALSETPSFSAFAVQRETGASSKIDLAAAKCSIFGVAVTDKKQKKSSVSESLRKTRMNYSYAKFNRSIPPVPFFTFH